MLFSKLSDKKKKIIGYCLPCVVIILIPFFDILLPYAVLGPLEKYPGLVGIIATVWIPISPSLLILSAIFSYRMARTHAIYDALMVVIYIFLFLQMHTKARETALSATKKPSIRTAIVSDRTIKQAMTERELYSASNSSS